MRGIRAGWLIDGTGAAAIEDGLVLCDAAGRIVYAGSARGGQAHLDAAAPDLSVLHVPGCTVLPGLIDAHVHLTFAARTPVPGAVPGAIDGRMARQAGPAVTAAQVDLITSDSAAQRVVRALAAAQAALAVGVTTMRDCGAKGSVIQELRDLIESGAVAGPLLQASGPPITTRAGHCWWLGGEADTADEAVAQVRERVKEGVDFIKIMATGGNLTRGSNSLESQYPQATLAAVATDAHRLGLQAVAHAHGVEGIAHCVDAGIDIIEHCSWQRPDGEAVDHAIAERMAAAGTAVGDTMAGFGAILLREGVSPEHVPAAIRARYGRGAELRAHGVTVLTSSDAMYPNRPFEDFPLGVAAAALYGGHTPEGAVYSATSLPARAMGLAATTGTIQAGLCADLLVVDGNVAADPKAIARTRWVIRDGVVVAGGGMLAAGVEGWR